LPLAAPEDGRTPEKAGHDSGTRQRGSILIGVLWCMVLLAMVVIGVLHTARMDLSVAQNYGDRVQAHYLALAGVERAKALIYQDTVARQGTAKSHTGALYDDAADFKDTAFSRGHFQVFHRAPAAEGGAMVYGVSDEESRLNINSVGLNQLTNNSALAGMTPDIAASIMAWRGPKTQVVAGGAQSDYYMSLKPPYQARSGPFQTLRELLMVRGVTRELLLGNDRNQNGFLDANDAPEDQDPRAPARAEEPPDAGWSAMLTVMDTDKNVGADGKDRINVQTADQATLTGLPGITPTIASAIISYRGQNQFQSVADLLDVKQTQQNQPAQNGNGNAGSGGNQPSSSSGNSQNGPTLISEELFSQIADNVSVSDDEDLTGLININTASASVLDCLPGIDPSLAQAIVAFRQSSGYFPNVAGLLKVDGMSRNVFKQVVPLVTARSETYRIISEGKVDSTGARQRVEEIVHIGRRDIETIFYREDL
jgi:competence ComEA-like helix-hairpin-helix protein